MRLRAIPALHVRCMYSTCALHVLCMSSACALHVNTKQVPKAKQSESFSHVVMVSLILLQALQELSEVLNRQKDEEATLSRDNWQSVVLLSTNKASRERGEPVPVALDSPEAELAPIPVPLSLIVAIGTDRIEVPGDVRPASVRDSVLKNLSYYVFERCASYTAHRLHLALHTFLQASPTTSLYGARNLV